MILDRVEGRASPGRYHLSQELKKVLEGFHAYLTKSTALKECIGPERADAQHVRDSNGHMVHAKRVRARVEGEV